MFDTWVAACPLHYTSPNAPKKRAVLGTMVLSILAGHRSHHGGARRWRQPGPAGDGASEDAVRRALKKMPETDAEVWLRRHLDETPLPLLGVPWILDVDTTVKPLFGHQEGAGYNPHKPGRPSHTLHTDWVAGLRRVLEVKAGNEPSSAHSAPALWGLLGRDRWPWLRRGDADFGTERIMSRAEPEGVPYLFKLRSTRTVKRLIEKAMGEADWTAAGQGGQGKASTLRLQGWSRHRRVIILRRRLAGEVLVTDRPGGPAPQLALSFAEVTEDRAV
jgi:hypothetical protein